jgi:2-C-methyl-D-erythritol 4-phosphate cytidylyltransferase
MNWLIILGGGKGSRVGKNKNKVLLEINQMPVIYWTMKTAQDSSIIDKIIVVIQKKHFKTIKKFSFPKVVQLIEPTDSTRQDSTNKVLNLLKNQINDDDLVGIHNAANPFTTRDEIKRVFEATQKHQAALLAVRVIDTIKITDNDGFAIDSPLKINCWGAQTPQVGKFKVLKKAFQTAQKDNFQGTDDTQLMLRIGVKAKIVECSRNNFKITYPEDLVKAEKLFKEKAL